jgi:signal transduction histidine kinase
MNQGVVSVLGATGVTGGARGIRTSRVSGFWLLISGVIATIGTVAFTLATMELGQDETAAEIRAQRIRGAAREVLIDTIDAETGQRGYLLTGDQAYLDVYEGHAWEAALAELDTSSGGDYRALITDIGRVLGAKREEMATTIALYRRGEHNSAYALIASDVGRQLMNKVRSGLGEIIDAEDIRVDAAHARMQQLSSLATAVTLTGGAITSLALVIGIIWLRKRTLEVTALAEERAAHTARLEEQGEQLAQGMVLLTATNRALARSNRDLDQFAYVASHDLKAPLRAISSLSTWIEEDLGDRSDAKVREHLRLLRTRVHRMEDLIAGILGYSRAGREVEAEDVDVRALVAEVCEQVVPPAGVTVEVAETPWPVIRTARVQLSQVFANLLSNAFVHGVPDGGRVELGCERDPEDVGAWRFRVTDTGPGIAPAYHERIFELFQRLTSRDRVEGAGIGLSIVRKLVDTNGGRVWVASEPGEGSTFFFTWSPKA